MGEVLKGLSMSIFEDKMFNFMMTWLVYGLLVNFSLGVVLAFVKSYILFYTKLKDDEEKKERVSRIYTNISVAVMLIIAFFLALLDKGVL